VYISRFVVPSWLPFRRYCWRVQDSISRKDIQSRLYVILVGLAMHDSPIRSLQCSIFLLVRALKRASTTVPRSHHVPVHALYCRITKGIYQAHVSSFI
jgi:hypothetical protein